MVTSASVQLATLPMFDLSGIKPSPQLKGNQFKPRQLSQPKHNQHKDSKGKGREKVQPEDLGALELPILQAYLFTLLLDTRLWVERYEPESEVCPAMYADNPTYDYLGRPCCSSTQSAGCPSLAARSTRE